MNSNSNGVRVIVEGPECVGKDTFIQKLLTAMSKRVVGQESVPGNKVRRRLRTGRNFFNDLNNRQIKKIFKHDTSTLVPVTMDKLHAVKVINFIDNCQETREFYGKMHAGVLTQLEIAEEFLQVHYDNELYTRNCEAVYDIVIMNRALPTYKANQIIGDGLTQFEENWQKLVNHSYEDEAIFVLLKAPAEVVKERLNNREKEDFRGDIEQHYLARHEKISEYYQEVLHSGYYSETLEVDTSSSLEEQDAAIEQLLALIHNRLSTNQNHLPSQAQDNSLEEVQPSGTDEIGAMFSE